MNLTDINELIYAAAAVIAKEKSSPHEPKTTKWKARIQETNDTCRRDLAVLREYKKGNSSQKVQNPTNQISKKYNLNLNQLDELENKVAVKFQAESQGLRRYNKRNDNYHKNKLLNDDMKKFYRQMNNQTLEIKDHPIQESIEQFWRGILENEVSHNQQAKWIQQAETITWHSMLEVTSL